MKFTVTLKDPDGPSTCIDEAVRAEFNEMQGLSDDEKEMLAEHRVEELGEFVSKWLRWGEYATIEFDTEAGTATLVKPR